MNATAMFETQWKTSVVVHLTHMDPHGPTCAHINQRQPTPTATNQRPLQAETKAARCQGGAWTAGRDRTLGSSGGAWWCLVVHGS